MEKSCKDLIEHVMKIINYEKKEIIPLTDEENECCEMQKVCYICMHTYAKKDLILIKMMKIHLNYTIHSEIIVIIQKNLEELLYNLRYKTPKEIHVILHIGSIYDYHFIIKQLAKEFEGQFKCLGESTEK